MVQRRPRRFTSLYTLQSTVATKAVRYIIHVWIHTVHNFGFRSVQRYKFCTVRYGPVNRMYWSWYCTVQVARPSRRRRGVCSTRTAGACIILYRRRRCASFSASAPRHAASVTRSSSSRGQERRCTGRLGVEMSTHSCPRGTGTSCDRDCTSRHCGQWYAPGDGRLTPLPAMRNVHLRARPGPRSDALSLSLSLSLSACFPTSIYHSFASACKRLLRLPRALPFRIAPPPPPEALTSEELRTYRRKDLGVVSMDWDAPEGKTGADGEQTALG